ncbi:hypothetical protein R1sor_001587 [Riccia sorocarpa]|uniref:Uncharacterized protein n=1 Tax=Riccia sorocarpa TaxID=122646 RepID=A0ABD3GWC9_9MARC
MLRVHLYHMQGPDQLVSMGLIGFKEGETLLSLRNKLESTQYFSSSFQFWDSRLASPVHIKLEGLIFIEDLEGKVVVFETKDFKAGIDEVAGKGFAEQPMLNVNKEVALVCDAPVEYTESEEIAVNSSVASSGPSVAGDDSLEGKALFLSKKMSAAAKAAWRDQVEKLIMWQNKVNKGDHAWRLNEEDPGERNLFHVEGDFDREPCYSWIFRVRCVFRAKKFELVPTKRNLKHNLRKHLQCEQHRINVERDWLELSQGHVRSGSKGRLRKSDPRDMKKQRSIDSFFGGARTVNSSSSPSAECATGEEVTRGLQLQNFQEINNILSAAKLYHGIQSNVPVILAEDETRVKPRVRWEPRRDTLIGFCGEKVEHVCKVGIEIEVGSGEAGYSKIVDSFEHNIQGSYVRVVIVNPLHVKLPKLVLFASTTCNSFSADWVRVHWDALKESWDQSCRSSIGPIIGHASDGDSRRRKLMVQDYLATEGDRWSIPWEGWIFSGKLLDAGDVYGLGDQDPIHNRKKLVNPLDRSSFPLVLGDYHACLEHVHLVYKLYSHDEHGLNFDDVIRRDRQNWAGPQRLCSRRVQHCNTKPLSEKHMVSIECFLDVQMSCHFVVLLCRLFRDKFPGLPIPLDLLGSDCCEHFFSWVGGMSGCERNYDFGDLINCASGLNKAGIS